MRKIEALYIHHSASPVTTRPATIRKWHVERNGWRDVGYHHLIDSRGIVFPGRPIWETGAHVRGHNRASVGVCVIGDNTVAGREWLPLQIGALVSYVRAWQMLVPGIIVRGHRDAPGAATECPGLDVGELLRDRGLRV